MAIRDIWLLVSERTTMTRSSVKGTPPVLTVKMYDHTGTGFSFSGHTLGPGEINRDEYASTGLRANCDFHSNEKLKVSMNRFASSELTGM